MKRQNGHFWLPLARRDRDTSEPCDGGTNGSLRQRSRTSTEKMNEELPVEEPSTRVVRNLGERTPEERSAHDGTHLPSLATGRLEPRVSRQQTHLAH